MIYLVGVGKLEFFVVLIEAGGFLILSDHNLLIIG